MLVHPFLQIMYCYLQGQTAVGNVHVCGQVTRAPSVTHGSGLLSLGQMTRVRARLFQLQTSQYKAMARSSFVSARLLILCTDIVRDIPYEQTLKFSQEAFEASKRLDGA